MSQQQRSHSVERLRLANEADWIAVNELLPQLSGSAHALSFEDYAALVTAEANRVYVVRTADRQQRIIGFAMLLVVQQIIGVKCWIEDVIVDAEYRGRGIARAMMLHAIVNVPADTKHINLTSQPHRGAAHGLYHDLGFKERDTAVFRLTLQ